MKWGRKKASSTSSHSSLIPHHVFPFSWLSKFKQKKGCSDPKSVKAKQKGQQDMSFLGSSSRDHWKEGRFYCGDDDSYWRLSFGEERKKSISGLNPVSYDSVEREEICKFNDMVSDVRKTRKSQPKVGISQQNDAFGGKEAEVPRRTSVKDQRSRESNGKTSDKNRTERVTTKVEQTTSKSVEKMIFEVQPEKTIHSREGFGQSRASESRKQRSFSFPNSNLRTIEEDFILEALNLEKANVLSEVDYEEGEGKIKEMMSKSEQQRKSVHITRNCHKKRRKQTSRTKACSPRTSTKIECKIRALEDMKKKKKKERILDDTTAFDSYAVVKSSFNPQMDFRDSMIEMIMEKGIERPEELEDLLACYLTLNCDEHHDLIIKVFRQVWFELNAEYLGPEVENAQLCDSYLLLSR